MAEVQLRQSDASRWRIHYMQWRDRFGIGSVYIKNLQDVIILAVKSDGLAVEKKEQLAALIREIDAERSASVTSEERIDTVTTAINTQDCGIVMAGKANF